MESILVYNTQLFYAINHINSPFLNFVMPLVSVMGSLIVWSILCLIIFLLGGEKGKHVAILTVLALLLTTITVSVLKVVVAEPRPFVTLNNVTLLTSTAVGYYSSFPSGHTAESFAFAVVVGFKYKIRFLNNLRLAYPLLAFAILVGFSRIYIGVHYPLDVLFGATIGIICAIIILKAENSIKRLYKKKLVNQ